MHRLALVPMILLVLSVAAPALAQNETHSEPATDRGTSLEAEVVQLKKIVAEHERRIAALEAQLAKTASAPAMAEPGGESAETAPAEAAEPMATEMSMKPTAPAASQAKSQAEADLPPWAREEIWRKIQIGMTEDEVLALLGPPDSTRELGFSRTLIYRGTVPGRGYLKGTVKLKDGQVSDLDLPAF